jgi:hypothetical protein
LWLMIQKFTFEDATVTHVYIYLSRAILRTQVSVNTSLSSPAIRFTNRFAVL